MGGKGRVSYSGAVEMAAHGATWAFNIFSQAARKDEGTIWRSHLKSDIKKEGLCSNYLSHHCPGQRSRFPRAPHFKDNNPARAN